MNKENRFEALLEQEMRLAEGQEERDLDKVLAEEEEKKVYIL